MGGFRSFVEIEYALDWLSATFPELISQKFSIGQSIEGRELWVIRVSDNPNQYEPEEPTAWFDALHHAREPMSAEALLRFAYWLASEYQNNPAVARLLQSRNILLMPCVNPDGYEYNRSQNPDGGGLWRKNRRDNGDGSFGVDLNRNYSWQWGRDASATSSQTYQGTAAFSEPETAAIRDFLAQQAPTASVSVHSYGNQWVFPWGWSSQLSDDDTILRAYAAYISASSGYGLGTAWELFGFSYGASDDYHYATFDSLTYTLEIGSNTDGFWPAPERIPLLFATVRPGLQTIAQAAGAWAANLQALWQEQQGNGDAWFDPGESWQLRWQAENHGVATLNAQISLAEQQANLNLAAHQSGESEALLFSFPEDAAREQGYALQASLTYDRISSALPIKVYFGPERVLIAEDMESAGVTWQVSNPEQVWAWQRAEAEQSSADGQILQAAGNGNHAWVTGAAAGDDVEGATWLTSPRFQAADLRHLSLSYQRWFVNAGEYQDDYLSVEVSNDDGTTWQLLESVKNSTDWQSVQFELSEYLSLSDAMRVRFRVADETNNDNTEAAIDDFQLSTHSYKPLLSAWGQTIPGELMQLNISGPANTAVTLFGSSQISDAYYVEGVSGAIYLAGQAETLLQTTTDAQGWASWLFKVPEYSAPANFYLQALFNDSEQAQISNLLTLSSED